MAQIREGGREPLRSASGEALTKDIIEALASEAEKGYDLSKADWRRAKHPSGPDASAARVSFRASSALYEAARARARREGRSLSDLAREAMERYINAGST